MNRWLPLNTIPRVDGCRCLVWDGDCAESVAYNSIFDSFGQISDSGRFTDIKPLMWMPLPPGPESGEESGIDVGDTTSGNVHVSVFHGEERASIIIDPDHATRVAERLWDCAATGRAVQAENQPQDSIP